MTHHNPETGRDEIFVGNTDKPLEADLLSGVPSIRLGHVAYCVDGKRLPDPWKPVFIHRSDSRAHDAVYAARHKVIDAKYRGMMT